MKSYASGCSDRHSSEARRVEEFPQVRQQFTEQQFEQRITAFLAFSQDHEWTVNDLGDGPKRRRHFLVWGEEANAVEVIFLRRGSIHVSVEDGACRVTPPIRPLLLSWAKQVLPDFIDVEEWAFSGKAQNAFAEGDGAAIDAADRRWIATHFEAHHSTIPDERPAYGDPSRPLWRTKPVPATVQGQAGAISVLEVEFDTSQGRLCEEFAIFLRDCLAASRCMLLGAVTFPGSYADFGHVGASTQDQWQRLTTIQIYLFQAGESPAAE